MSSFQGSYEMRLVGLPAHVSYMSRPSWVPECIDSPIKPSSSIAFYPASRFSPCWFTLLFATRKDVNRPKEPEDEPFGCIQLCQWSNLLWFLKRKSALEVCHNASYCLIWGRTCSWTCARLNVLHVKPFVMEVLHSASHSASGFRAFLLQDCIHVWSP